jgi:hypothetical protein
MLSCFVIETAYSAIDPNDMKLGEQIIIPRTDGRKTYAEVTIINQVEKSVVVTFMDGLPIQKFIKTMTFEQLKHPDLSKDPHQFKVNDQVIIRRSNGEQVFATITNLKRDGVGFYSDYSTGDRLVACSFRRC